MRAQAVAVASCFAWEPAACRSGLFCRLSALAYGCCSARAVCSRRPACLACRGRKRWILSVPVRGEVWLDEGARRAVQDRKKSLFSAGIVHVTGDFEAQVRACMLELDVGLGRAWPGHGTAHRAALAGT